MICIILAAGKGTRLRPLTNTTPKALLKIQGKPILAYILESLPDEITRVIIVVKHLGELIEEYFGKKWGDKKITYVHAASLKGTADMIRQTKKFIKGKTLVLMGDDLYQKNDLTRFIKETKEGEWGILGKEVKNPQDFGVFRFNDDGKVGDIIERPQSPPSNVINTGAYLFDKRFFLYKPVKIANGEYGLPQTLVKASKDIPIKIVKAAFWLPTNTLQDYEEAKKNSLSA